MPHAFDELPALVERLEQMDESERADAVWQAVHESEAGHWTGKRGRVMVELHGIVVTADTDAEAARAWYHKAMISKRVTERGRAA